MRRNKSSTFSNSFFDDAATAFAVSDVDVTGNGNDAGADAIADDNDEDDCANDLLIES